jgi:bifunctional UDP-N-acetylglucosamine pyrophosphorylase / glucosamine-1-phosphate N-acetyltransferase
MMKCIALILAAGKGTRMKSDLIKVLHPILGKTMLQWSIDTAIAAGLEPWVVVGHQEQRVRESLVDQDITFVRQTQARGTGHAVRCALDFLPNQGTLVVFFGDTPLFTKETMRKLVDFHADNYATFLTSKVAEPSSYGRLVRDDSGRAIKIVEAAEASVDELLVNEINTGASVFDLAWLKAELPSFQPHAPKNEIYLTDALERASNVGKSAALIIENNEEAEGVNDRWGLSEATKVLQKRIIRNHTNNGVSFEDVASVTVGSNVTIDKDTWVGRGAIIKGNCSIESNVKIAAYCCIEDCIIGRGVSIREFSHCFQAKIESDAIIGPYARLRELTTIGSTAKIGNFVEIKKTVVGKGAKANHLTYLGDSQIGAGANVGAGTITCNYDGFSKNSTIIGEGAFIGSNSSLVAPVNIEKGAIIGAGSTITKDVPQDAIAIARGSQNILKDAAIRFREKRR